MSSGKHAGGASESNTAVAEEEPAEVDAGSEEAIDKLLERVERSAANPALAASAPMPGLRTARVVSLDGRNAEIVWRGQVALVLATVADEVDPSIVRRAIEEHGSVLVEVVPGSDPVIVGIVQTRAPSAVEIRGETITIEAEREILLRAGRTAVRLREDGDLEIVGSRISAMSRGLFRLVGRVLRLN